MFTTLYFDRQGLLYLVGGAEYSLGAVRNRRQVDASSDDRNSTYSRLHDLMHTIHFQYPAPVLCVMSHSSWPMFCPFGSALERVPAASDYIRIVQSGSHEQTGFVV